MAELVYAQHLKCCPFGDVGSTPTLGTEKNPVGIFCAQRTSQRLGLCWGSKIGTVVEFVVYGIIKNEVR